MRTRIETVMPDDALNYLAMNMVNRRISPERVNAYAYSMANGDWQQNGESIKFNKRGELIDGQHRLSAVIKSGKPVTMLIAYDIDDDVNIIDRNRPRSATDVLRISGFTKCVVGNTTVAIVKLYAFMQEKLKVVSDSYIRDFVKKNEIYISRVNSLTNSRANQNSGIKLRNASVCLGLLYALNDGVTETELERFIDVLRKGFYKSESETAAIVLRNDIISGKFNTSDLNKKVVYVYAVENAIHDFVSAYPRKRSYLNSKYGYFSSQSNAKDMGVVK